MLDNSLAPIDLTDSANNAIKNITNEPTKNIGTTLADCWFIVFGGISQVAQKRRLKYAQDLEQYHSELNNAISSIPEPNLIEPSIQITTQALENSKYCVSEKELRKLFVNLISSSMDSSRVSLVHPCFAEIIKQMSPIDARVLKTFPIKDTVPIVDYIRKSEDKSYSTELSNVYLPNIDGVDVFQASSSISSLIRLGLISISKSSIINDPSRYNIYEKSEFFKSFSDETMIPEIPTLKKYIGILTSLGQNFVYSCVL